jgi:hypothetical protein
MEENAKPKEYISIKDAAELLDRAFYTVYHYWHQGRIEGRQYGKGGRIEIDKASAERFLKRAVRKSWPRPPKPDLTTEPDAVDQPSAGPQQADAATDPEERPESRGTTQPGQESAA